jgi:hypothetical protein
MNSHELVSVPDNWKVAAEAPSNDLAEYTSSVEWHYPSNAAELIGKSVVRNVIQVSHDDDAGMVIDVVPGIVRKEPLEAEVAEITPRGDLRTIPGTDAFAERQQELANIAHSELAASNAHTRK